MGAQGSRDSYRGHAGLGRGGGRDSILLGTKRRQVKQQGVKGEKEYGGGRPRGESGFSFHCNGTVSGREGVLLPAFPER